MRWDGKAGISLDLNRNKGRSQKPKLRRNGISAQSLILAVQMIDMVLDKGSVSRMTLVGMTHFYFFSYLIDGCTKTFMSYGMRARRTNSFSSIVKVKGGDWRLPIATNPQLRTRRPTSR